MTPQIAALFGFGRDEPSPSFADWQGTILADDFLKLRAAIEDAAHTGSFYAEFRVRGSDGRHDDVPMAMNTVLWPATLGYSFSSSTIKSSK